MKKKKSVIQVLKLLPSSQIEQIGKSLGIDSNVSRLFGDRMLKLLIFTSLRSNEPSTRLMESFYNSNIFSKLSGKGGHQTRHSSIASRLSSMNSDYFKMIFEKLLEQFQTRFEQLPKFKKIQRFDSTLVPISSALVDWGMRVGSPPKSGYPKVQLKFTLQMHAELPSSVKPFFTQEYLSEETALKQAIEQAKLGKDDLIVFDAGLKSRQTLKVFDQQGLHFITRAHNNVRYEVIEPHKKIKGRKANGLKFLRDDKVHLYQKGKALLEHPFRLIEAQVIQTGESIFFITNVWNLTAMQIAQIYRQRWDIEVFFRFIKQQLGIKHLVNRSENGVKIQIYIALITAILLLVYKNENNISSYKIAKVQFVDELLFILFKELSEKPPT